MSVELSYRYCRRGHRAGNRRGGCADRVPADRFRCRATPAQLLGRVDRWPGAREGVSKAYHLGGPCCSAATHVTNKYVVSGS
jgi:hypothetical protein